MTPRAALAGLMLLAAPGTALAQAAHAPGAALGGALPPGSAIPSLGQAMPGALDRAFHTMNGGAGGGMTLSLQMLLIMGLLTILPSLILMMTSFTRILIVLSILRQALGLQQSPPNQI